MADLSQRDSFDVRELQARFHLRLENPIFGGQIFDPRQQLLVNRPRDVGQEACAIHSSPVVAESQLIAPRNRSYRHPARLRWESTTHRLFYGFNFLVIRRQCCSRLFGARDSNSKSALPLGHGSMWSVADGTGIRPCASATKPTVGALL
jgi:hypothetical protein